MSERLACSYLDAKRRVATSSHSVELAWQEEVSLSEVTVTRFLQEAAWVILSCGMRSSVIGSIFPSISEIFLDWEEPRRIALQPDVFRDCALRVFGHTGKVDAIVNTSIAMAGRDDKWLSERLSEDAQGFLIQFPFLGPVTSIHLAKNLGIDAVKPDRHLCRIASAVGYSDPTDMCMVIQRYTNDRLALIDLVLWRFATLDSDYERFFAAAK